MYRDVVQWSKIRHRILVRGSAGGLLPRTALTREPSARCWIMHYCTRTARGAIGIRKA